MADYKNKKPKKKESPKGKTIPLNTDPDSYLSEHPAWRFSACDKVLWQVLPNTISNAIWNEIFTFLQNFETMTWVEILHKSNDKHHPIPPNHLNKTAQERLIQLHIEPESIMSLRLSGTHRLYGYMDGNVFYALWFDTNHGDNLECVCCSILKHT